MTTRDIISKLTRELDAGITSEVQVVYMLAGVRKLIERDGVKDQYPDLNFHCDWTLHSKLEGTFAKSVLRKFDAAHALLRDKKLELRALPANLKAEINRISKMRSFERELSGFLETYKLPPLTKKRPDGWGHFLYLYGKVIEDIPLVVADKTATGPKHISQVVVHLEEAPHDIGGEALFKVTWTIHDKNGKSGEIFVINSFSRTA
jgi:hypothetical protein